MTVFLEWMEWSVEVEFDCESQNIKKTVLFTTVAELYSFNNVLWFMSVSPWIVDGHIR